MIMIYVDNKEENSIKNIDKTWKEVKCLG